MAKHVLHATIDIPDGVTTNLPMTAEHIQRLLQTALDRSGYQFHGPTADKVVVTIEEVRV